MAPIAATTKELGEATTKALGVNGSKIDFDIVGQANHGVTAVGNHPWSAFEHIERLNHICEILLASGVTPEEIHKRKSLA